MSERTPNEIRADGSMDDDFAFYQAGIIYAIFQDNSFIEARRIIAETLRGYQTRIAALESEREVYLSTNRAIKNYANDQETVISNQAARIAALEAEIDALKNPPYRIVFNLDGWWIDGKFHPLKYQAGVMCGNHQLPFEGDWHDTEDAARAEAQQFIDKLPAPFGAKEE